MSFLNLLASSLVLDPRLGGRHGGKYGGGGILLESDSLDESDEMSIYSWLFDMMNFVLVRVWKF